MAFSSLFLANSFISYSISASLFVTFKHGFYALVESAPANMALAEPASSASSSRSCSHSMNYA